MGDVEMVVREDVGDGVDGERWVEGNEGGEGVWWGMVGIGVGGLGEVGDGDEMDRKRIGGEEWEKGMCWGVVVFGDEVEGVGEEFEGGKCWGVVGVIDEGFVGMVEEVEIGFGDGKGVYEGCWWIGGEKKEVRGKG